MPGDTLSNTLGDAPLVILLNGPLGIGKSTLAEALGEAVPASVTLNGDALLALNPPPDDEQAALHETVALLFAHHLARGYRTFIVDHYWPDEAAIEALAERLRAEAPNVRVRPFLLTLPIEDNLRRIARRQSVRAIDETAFEAICFAEEHAHLAAIRDTSVGERFDVGDPPARLIERMRTLLGV